MRILIIISAASYTHLQVEEPELVQNQAMKTELLRIVQLYTIDNKMGREILELPERLRRAREWLTSVMTMIHDLRKFCREYDRSPPRNRRGLAWRMQSSQWFVGNDVLNEKEQHVLTCALGAWGWTKFGEAAKGDVSRDWLLSTCKGQRMMVSCESYVALRAITRILDQARRFLGGNPRVGTSLVSHGPRNLLATPTWPEDNFISSSCTSLVPMTWRPPNCLLLGQDSPLERALV